MLIATLVNIILVIVLMGLVNKLQLLAPEKEKPIYKDPIMLSGFLFILLMLSTAFLSGDYMKSAMGVS